VVLTTQYLEEADRLADRVTVIDRGQAVATGQAAELKSAYGADVIELFAADQSVAEQAARMLIDRAGLSQGTARVADDAAVSVTVPAGRYSVVAAVRLLDAEGLHLDDIRVRNATLDEVFAALTARTEADA
jgi:ABC-2 type transport system ATP-binding protein